MRSIRFAAVALALGFLLGAQPVGAAPLFFDNFDSENGGVAQLNYIGFANWTVSGGTVDLIGAGSIWDFLPGNGLYVDMDGSTGNAGIMTSNSFTFSNGYIYTLSFDLAGNRRNSAVESVLIKVSLGSLLNTSISLAMNAPFTPYSYSFAGDGTSGSLLFEGVGGDNIGLLLDDVSLDRVPAVPEPASLFLLGTGLVAVGRRFRSRR